MECAGDGRKAGGRGEEGAAEREKERSCEHCGDGIGLVVVEGD